MIKSCNDSGIASFTGDGVNPNVMIAATNMIKKQNGMGIPTVKPWNIDIIKEKMKLVADSNAFAVAMDIDGAGLPFLKNLTPKAGSKTVEELREIKEIAKRPFIIKGIMTAKGAIKARESGADGVVIARTFVIALYGGGEEGVKSYINQLGAELEDAMTMCGVHSLKEINRDVVRF